MKKFLLILSLFPSIVLASTREIDNWSNFKDYIQPQATKMLTQNGMKVEYAKNEKTLTDKLTYTIGGKIWSTKGPWSLATPTMRNKVMACKRSNPGMTASSCGWYDYAIIRLSPSGRYVELSGMGYESEMWRMLDTKTGRIVLSNDNGVSKSMWTRDRQQFIWQTHACEIGGCSDLRGTFITELGKFPKYTKVSDETR